MVSDASRFSQTQPLEVDPFRADVAPYLTALLLATGLAALAVGRRHNRV
jgi:hypothetical protein